MTTATATTTESHLGGDYPTDWDGFIGQSLARRQLITAARSAKARNTAMDHILLASGVPGIGKTTLALLAAGEMAANVRVVSGKITAPEARLMLSDMDDGDFLIIDEIHLLVSGGKAAAEGWLLHMLQDGVILGPRGPEVQPNVTIVGCTTDVGKLPSTIRDRFMITPKIVDYSDDEGAAIALTMAHRMFSASGLAVPSIDNCRTVALAATNNPRVMRSVLITTRDLALAEEISYDFTESNDDQVGYDLTIALEWGGLTRDGLTTTCQRYIVALLREFAGEPAGEKAMSDRLQEPGGLRDTERLLARKELIVTTKRGRCLTQAGIKRARQLEHDA